MFINAYLLSAFLKKSQFTSHSGVFNFRNQALAIIYINLAITSLLGIYCSFLSIYIGNLYPYSIVIVYLIPSMFSFYYLRDHQFSRAGDLIIIGCHVTNFAAIHYMNLPLACITAQLVFPPFAYVFGCSNKIRWANIIAGLIQIFLGVYKAHDIFKFTVTDEQFYQLLTFYLTLIFLFLLICIVLLLVEEQMSSALGDIQKLQAVTKEVVQLMEAKDAFVSSLSHEIRNPLNAILGSIDYLSELPNNPGPSENATEASESLVEKHYFI